LFSDFEEEPAPALKKRKLDVTATSSSKSKLYVVNGWLRYRNPDNGWYPLQYAVYSGSVDLIKKMIELFPEAVLASDPFEDVSTSNIIYSIIQAPNAKTLGVTDEVKSYFNARILAQENLSWAIIDFLGKITYKDESLVIMLNNAVQNTMNVLAADQYAVGKMNQSTWIIDFLKLGYNQLNTSDRTLLNNITNRPSNLNKYHSAAYNIADKLSPDQWGIFPYAFAFTLYSNMNLQKAALAAVPANGSHVYIRSKTGGDLSMDVHDGVNTSSFKMYQNNETDAQKFNINHIDRGFMFVRTANTGLAMDKNANFGDTCWLMGTTESNNNQVWVPYKYRDMSGDNNVVLLNMGNYDKALCWENTSSNRWVQTCECLELGNEMTQFHFQTF
jgi:hypothetical protein